MRDGIPFATYGLKIISSRQPPSDAALLSRGLIVSMLPTNEELTPLDDATLQRIAKEFQAKLLTFRLNNRGVVKNFSLPPHVLAGPNRRIKQIAHALIAPLLGDPTATAQLINIFFRVDEEARAERCLEPEWLVAFALFDLCHDNLRQLGIGVTISNVHVGALAERTNEKLRSDGEGIRLTARKVGAVLNSLDLHTQLLDRSGRGMKFTSALESKIHDLARRLGIDRRTIAFSGGLEAGNGGLPCPYCDRHGLGGGLRFAHSQPLPKTVLHGPRRAALFEVLDPKSADESLRPVDEE
jgi:hypothetical protein